MKETARGSVALACLPSKDQLNSGYTELCQRIDEIVKKAEQEGSLRVAIAGLNSIRQTLDSMARLAGYDQRIDTQVNVAVENNIKLEISSLAERLVRAFDHEPDVKSRIAQALLQMEEQSVGDEA